MAWLKVSYRLTSDCPVIFHNGQTADPTNKWSKAIKAISAKKKKTDADHEEMARLEFLAGWYMGPNGPVIPSTVLDAMITRAAMKQRQGPKAKSGVYALRDAELEYEGPRTPNELWGDEQFRFVANVRVQSARIVRTRPCLPKWEATIEFTYENTELNLAELDEWMRIAGTQVGIGDWRPQHGRFTAVRID